MSKTYQATGIILKGMAIGEADRLVTVLTPEYGLLRAVVPGARKYKSSLRGRSELFVVNQLLLVKGRSLDKIVQAETLGSYPGLSRDLGKLAGGQYLAELALCLALSEQSQEDLYELVKEHLGRIEGLDCPQEKLHAHLAQGVFHLLVVGGIAPQVLACCLSQETLTANFNDPRWRVGFSFEAGGLVNLALGDRRQSPDNDREKESQPAKLPPINTKLGAVELSLLQHLGGQFLPQPGNILPATWLDASLTAPWMRVERLLREYAQYHCGRCFRAAALVDSLTPLDF